MNDLNSWIYVDYTNSIWRFSRNDNKELCYSIMYGEGKWTKARTIDKNILGFAVYIEEDGKIHIIYSNTKGEIKYCTLKDNRWIGKTVYLMDSDEFEIHDLSINIIGGEMHIFYLLVELNGSNHGVLIHSIWDGKEVIAPKLLDVILTPKVKENYIVKVDKMNNIDMLFFTDEGSEIALNYCCYKKNKWSVEKRLYSIQGDYIELDMLNDQKNIHILNKYKDGSTYYLDHVRVEMGEYIQDYRVCESEEALSEPLVFELNDRLYACWLQGNKIYHAVFDGVYWSKPVYFNRGNDEKVNRYHFYIACDKEVPIKEREVYGTGHPNLNLFFPSQFAIRTKRVSKAEVNQNEETNDDINQIRMPRKVEALQNLKMQLYRDKSENKQLKRTLASLRIQIQKKQRMIDEYKQTAAKVMEQKQKSDENCDVFIELQNKLQSELDSANRLLIEERKHKENIEDKLKEYESENASIKQQNQQLIEENDRLHKELELEKNKTIIERFLKP